MKKLSHYITAGSVRGECGHRHRTLDGAVACLRRDRDGCASQGGYSDRYIVRVDSEGSRHAIRIGPVYLTWTT